MDRETASASPEGPPSLNRTRGTSLTPWLAATVVVILRSLPFLRLAFGPRGSGGPFVLASYLPNDWLVYVALVRQSPPHGGLTLANPFTTDLQDGRLVLLLHQALNLIHRISGVDPFWLLELSRLPLTFAFFLVLWRLLGRMALNEGEKVWAVWLVALSGGLDWLARLVIPILPSHVAETVTLQLSGLLGWNTFGALWNPLWVAGMTLLLVFVTPLISPQPVERGIKRWWAVAVSFIALWCTHPYSGLAALVIVAGAWFACWLVRDPFPTGFVWRAGVAVATALLIVGALALWQVGDPVQRKVSGGVMGTQGWGAFWYPLTFAVPTILAVRHRSRWNEKLHSWGVALVGWMGAIAWLHSSPVFGGAHFVGYLYLPLCILAAPGVALAFDGLKRPGRVALLFALFTSPFALTWDSVRDAGSFRLPNGMDEVLSKLALLPPGNVLAHEGPGNVLPAFAPHRVYVGHAFMTPDYDARVASADRALSGRDPTGLHEILAGNRIDYVVAPSAVGGMLVQQLAGAVSGVRVVGPWTLILLTHQ
jgi:hypothetical protein